MGVGAIFAGEGHIPFTLRQGKLRKQNLLVILVCVKIDFLLTLIGVLQVVELPLLSDQELANLTVGI